VFRPLRRRALVLILPAIIMTLSGFTPATTPQYQGLGVGHDRIGQQMLVIALACKTTPYPSGNTCTGYGQGTLSGKRFVVSDVTTDLDPTSLTCGSRRCDGGTIEASGYGWLYPNQVAFDFCGYDADPSNASTMQLVIISGPAAATMKRASIRAADVFGPNCSVLSTGAVRAGLASIVYTFSCATECFDLIRTNR
jgi:hypothetical protein